MQHFSEELPNEWFGDVEFRKFHISKRGDKFIIYINGAYVDYAHSLQDAVDWCMWEHSLK